ncbi:MAG: hypothetical protein RIS56_18 [Verrucomicrobiota bacterium]
MIFRALREGGVFASKARYGLTPLRYGFSRDQVVLAGRLAPA